MSMAVGREISVNNGGNLFWVSKFPGVGGENVLELGDYDDGLHDVAKKKSLNCVFGSHRF